MGPCVQQGWLRPKSPVPSGSSHGTQWSSPLNVQSRSVKSVEALMSQQPWCSPGVLSVLTTGSEMAICRVGFIWRGLNFPPCAQVEETQAEFRKSTLTAAPPSPAPPSGGPWPVDGGHVASHGPSSGGCAEFMTSLPFIFLFIQSMCKHTRCLVSRVLAISLLLEPLSITGNLWVF